MMWLIIGIVIGLLLYNFCLFNKRGLSQFWEKHPVLRGIVIVLTMPIMFLIFLPIDYFQYGNTFKDYIQTYKDVLKQ